MSTTRAIYSNTAIQIIGKGISTMLGLLAVAIMTRSLGVVQFGYYSTAIGFLQFTAIIFDFGFVMATAKMLSEPNFDKPRLFNNLFSWRLITAVIPQALAAGLIWLFPYPIEIKIATGILAISFIANILNQVFVGYYQTKLKMGTVMVGEILGRVILVGGTLALAFGYRSFTAIMAVVAVAAWVYTIYLWKQSAGVKFQIDGEITRALYRVMWPTALAIIFNAFYLQGDRVLLPLFAPAADVAFYGAAYRVLDIMSQVAFLTMGVMLPLLTHSWSRGLKEEFKKYYQLSFDLMLLVLLPMAAGTIVLSEPIMRLIAGSGFAGAGKILALLTISTVGVCFGSTFSQTAIAINKQKMMLAVFALDAFLSVIAYFIFIPRFGMYGAAGVTIFSEFFAGIALLILCSRATGLWPKFGIAAKIALSALIMGLIIIYLQPLNIIISIILGTVIYSGLSILLKIVSLNTIKDILRPNSEVVE